MSLAVFCHAETQLKVTVVNHSDRQRSEVVEIEDRAALAMLAAGNGSLIVTNAFGQEVPWQKTFDGKILIYATVQPFSNIQYTLGYGSPQKTVPFVGGRQYAERKDDISFENDRIGFRVYGPALQQSGEKSYGVDLWLKRTPELILDEIYEKRHYHLDNGKGLDCYNVGSTLGCGAPAVMVGDSIVYQWCYRDYRILDTGPLRFTLALDFNPLTVGNDTCIVEHRIMSLDKGSSFCKSSVMYDGLTAPCTFCTGLVIHRGDTLSVGIRNDYLYYADPTRDPQKYNFQIYTAVLFPNGIDYVGRRMFDCPVKDALGHVLGKRRMDAKEVYTYYIGAAWSEYDVRTLQEWEVRIQQFMDNKRCPLEVFVEK